jgi:hypothetical protein
MQIWQARLQALSRTFCVYLQLHRCASYCQEIFPSRE